MKRLIFKYGTSRARDTFGWNIVTLYVDGVKIARECGGGYDMRGSALGEWIQDYFQSELSALNNVDFHFRRSGSGKNIIDGAVGFETMRRILEALGWTLTYVADTKNADIYIAYPENVNK